jgi:thiol-disulfide isomerase/thioredoxin
LVRVTVTAADAERGELELPEIAAAVVPIPAVGDTPALAFKRADGSDGTLKECHGRYTVLHFWASWCGPCKQQLPALRRIHERFAARGVATLGLSLDDDTAAWQGVLKQLALPWQQGRLTAPGDAGVSSVPAYWLLDPSGKIVAKVYDTDELAKTLSARLK